MNERPKQTGFTLVEMSIVLVIVALLIGGVLAPLSARKEQERREENRQLLEEIRDALLGFAVVNGRLPCPDTSPLDSPNSGLENACALDATAYYSGRLPWVTLGIDARFDPWGDQHLVRYTVNGAFVDDITLTSAGAPPGELNIHVAANCTAATPPVAQNVPAVVWTSARHFYNLAPTSSADEIENADDDTCFVNRAYSTLTGSEFDDQMIWLSPNILFNRMISAGTLP